MASLNTLPAVPAARQPRAAVKISTSVGDTGYEVAGWVSLSVTNNTFFEADTFRVTYAASLLTAQNDAAWFADQTEVYVEIFAGFPSDADFPNIDELDSLIYGRVDDIEYDPLHRTLTLTGRDLTAAFIDTKITSQYTAKRSSYIATQLAQAHGLSVNVTATTTDVGTYYLREHVKLQADRSEWDLLCLLARYEGFVVFVQGQTLFFQPDTRDASDPYVIDWTEPTSQQGAPSSSAIDLQFTRSLTVVKGVAVTARSPSLTTKGAVQQSYPTSPRSTTPGKASPFGAVTQYYYTLPAGRTPTEVQQFAEQQYRLIVSHAMKLQARLPGDNLLSAKGIVKVRGTLTSFDQTYYPRSVTREMSRSGGYSMSLQAQNFTPTIAPGN